MQIAPSPIRSTVHARLRERQVAGLAVCGFTTDGIVFAEGLGLADVERAEVVTPDTVFRVASISKLLTTALALVLVDRGDLDLDEPVNRSLAADLQIAGLDGKPAPCTLRSLLSHTSGIGFGVRGVDPGNRVASRVLNGGRLSTLSDAIRGLRLAHEPDGRIVYSNPAFNVVGHLAATTVGTDFESAAQELVLDPLGMATSAFASDRRGPGIATPYGAIAPPGPGTERADAMRVVATPMGGLTSTVLDLARFGQMVLGEGQVGARRVLRAETIAEATTIQATNHPALDQGYGLGFKVWPWRGRTLVGHDGNMPGVSTQLVVSPSDGVGAVVLTNGYALGVPHEVARLVLEHLLDLAPDHEPRSAPPSPHDLPGWDALARRAAGRYRLVDSSPPGLLGRAAERMVRVEVRAGRDGRLMIDPNPASDGPMWLEPDGPLGRYRLASSIEDGTSAVVEERPDGAHIWLGFAVHLHRAT